MNSDTIVVIGGLMMLAGCTVLIRWASHARDLILDIWDMVRTDPANKERTR